MFSLTGIQAKIAEVVLCILLCVFAYEYVSFKAVEQYKQEQQIVQAKADKEQQKKYDKLSAEYEQLKLKRAENAKVIERKVETIIRDNPIYIRDCITPDGLSIANAAIESANTGIPASTMPASK